MTSRAVGTAIRICMSQASVAGPWVRQALRSTGKSGPWTSSRRGCRNVPRALMQMGPVPRSRCVSLGCACVEASYLQPLEARRVRLSARGLGKLRSSAQRHTPTTCASQPASWPFARQGASGGPVMTPTLRKILAQHPAYRTGRLLLCQLPLSLSQRPDATIQPKHIPLRTHSTVKSRVSGRFRNQRRDLQAICRASEQVAL